AAKPDLLVFLGDLTWGPLPEQTWAIVRALEDSLPERTLFVRGNAERALGELRGRAGAPHRTPRERWLVAQHSTSMLDALESFRVSLVVDVDGLGPTRFCHGSPRSDEELITPGTPRVRMRELLAGVPERVLISAHTHIQFDRAVEGVRSVNPGSVGMPYQGEAGAYWALLGPDVELRRSEYDLELALAGYRETGDPLADAMVETLQEPPTP